MASVRIVVAVGLLAVGAEGADCTLPRIYGASRAATHCVADGLTTLTETAGSTNANTCTPACVDGFEQTPAVPTLTCTTGTLNPPTFTCVPKQCTVVNSNMAPGKACFCNNGYTASNNGVTDQAIVWTGIATSSTCVAAACNVANSNMAPGPACMCNPGYVADSASSPSKMVTWAGTTPSSTCVPETTTAPPPTPAPTTPPPTTTPEPPSSTPWVPLVILIVALIAIAASVAVIAARKRAPKRGFASVESESE